MNVGGIGSSRLGEVIFDEPFYPQQYYTLQQIKNKKSKKENIIYNNFSWLIIAALIYLVIVTLISPIQISLNHIFKINNNSKTKEENEDNNEQLKNDILNSIILSFILIMITVIVFLLMIPGNISNESIDSTTSDSSP